MTRLLTVVLCALTLAGCASEMVWTRQSFTQQEFRRDDYECGRDSRTFGGGSGVIGGIMIIQAQRQADRMYRDCMLAKGWTLVKE